MKNLELSEEDLQFVIDALTFTSCTDIGMKPIFSRDVRMAELAAKLSSDNNMRTSEDLYYTKGLKPDDGTTLEILKPIVEGKESKWD